MTISIDFADPQQLSQISDLAHSIWREYYLGIISGPQIEFMLAADYSLDQLQKDRATGTNFLILKKNSQPIGFAAFQALDPSFVKLEKLYLAMQHHGKGLGKRLLDQAEQCAQALGATALFLNVNKHNARAIAAYRRAGYTHHQSVLAPIGAGFYVDDYVFQKQFTAASTSIEVGTPTLQSRSTFHQNKETLDE